ncbi:monocarboxylate transporter [Elysia marginata]|uniref:Monocarboxylate transporter n=1 Tax=Elysia marginata TaxID=1093978 RepID=A0AAV4G1U8_9GAST|nr:monocarboxylate transporter [Elysia marginata]
MLINRFSVRTSILLGTSLSTSGYVSTAYTTNIYWLFINYSVLQGFGRALVLTPAFVGVSMYFEKRRGQVLAIVTSGAGFGALLIMPVTQILQDTYQFQGAFLILGGIAMNGLVCALLFRPFSLHQKFNRKGKILLGQTKTYDTLQSSEKGHLISRTAEDSCSTRDECQKNLERKDPSHSANGWPNSQNKRDGKSCGHREEFFRPVKQITAFSSDCVKDDKESGVYTPKGHRNKSGYEQLKPGSSSEEDMDYTDIELGNDKECKNERKSVREMLYKCLKSCVDAVSTCFAVDSYDKNHETKSKVFHLSIFTHAPFVIICFSTVFYKLGNKTLLDFLPAISLEQGLTEAQVSLLLSMVQAADMSGKLVIGYAMDTELLKPYLEHTYILELVIMGALSLAVPTLKTFQAFCVIGILYGALSGASTIQRTLVVARMVDPDVLSSCFGVLYGFQGLGTLVGPPMAGKCELYFGSRQSVCGCRG